jgi:hypothetical protein
MGGQMNSPDYRTITLSLLWAHFEQSVRSLEGLLQSAHDALATGKQAQDAAKAETRHMRTLCDAAVQWRKDRFSPRLEQAIDAYRREEVLKR